jgi:alpha-tubulin suppressor-like RCC1 family protein
VHCWGYNADGQLGAGDVKNTYSATRAVPLGGVASALTAGAYHTCAIQGAAVKCWGANRLGQLGLGDTRNRGTAPTPIPPLTLGRHPDSSSHQQAVIEGLEPA